MKTIEEILPVVAVGMVIDQAMAVQINSAPQEISQLIDQARLEEARHWDEHIMGSPRKVTSNEKAKNRLSELQNRLTKGESK